MKHLIRLAIIGVLLVIAYFYLFIRKPTMIYALTEVKTSQDAIAIFPTSASHVHQLTEKSLREASQSLQEILEIPDDQRTYQNTALALDRLSAFSNLAIAGNLMVTLDLIGTDEQARDAARNDLLKIQAFYIDNIATNKKFYRAFRAYLDGNAQNESLNDEQRRYLKEMERDFKNAGLDLPDHELEKVKTLKKELTELELQFDKNIADKQGSITADRAELSGLSDSFINSLPKTDEGASILGVDYPTYIQVMDNCTNEQTRQKLWTQFVNRAYPDNKKVLESIIAKRSELAQLLGFSSYAALELNNEMAGTPARVQKFLADIHTKALKKAQKEHDELAQQLPSWVTLTKDGLFKLWDSGFIKNQYKKRALDLDENIIAEYFPMQHTVDMLLSIYQKFFNLEFKQIPVNGLWHSDVRMIEVIDKTTHNKIGYLFMDLFPRPKKYSHACEQTIIPVTYYPDGTPNQGVVLVVANFPKPREDQPSLLQFKDVNTFFHEFGHAMHALLGRTATASFAGTSVKRDFVEMPSQMLEEWMWSPEILTMISSHYKTGQPLPDDLINKILASRNFDAGFHVIRQLMLANISLNFFNNGPTLNLEQAYQKEFKKFMLGFQFEPIDHFYASFGHLGGYGARYYGYLWSSVFAHDLAHEIRQLGFLNPVVGRRYVDTVIGKGGSQDPNDMLKNFLGREPNQDAFLKDMGFE